MPESDSFIAGMSAVRFVRMMAELSGLPPGEALERAHEAFYYVGLGEARYRNLGTYSLGMKQLAKLAQAIAHGPQAAVPRRADQRSRPGSARSNDPPDSRDSRYAGEVNIILSSHLLRDVEECCEEVLILKDGRIVGNCNLEEERRANLNFIEMEVRRRHIRFQVGDREARAVNTRRWDRVGTRWCCAKESAFVTCTASPQTGMRRSAN